MNMFKMPLSNKASPRYMSQSVRMNKHDELSDFSSQSILCAMDRFVKAVNNMNETVMVPCRLLDMEVESKTSGEKVPVLLRSGGNPYSYYSVLNSVKNDLIWGPTSNDDDDNDNSASTTNNTRWSDPVAVSSAASTTSSASSSSGHVKGHMRRQSTLSMISMSSNASDGDSEGGCDGSEGGDSGVEAEDITPELTAAALTNNLRTHLLGLHTCLSNLTDTASFITERYQEEVNV
ncbi:mid1-interacting protein 1-like isoform X1 [Penaeus japonicus]|uniref:mid1-interacting protein 1-like isoform X1 n=1 Tax=Penaeus japonicus TaxID=27405 RepID=UPI001C7127C4|nr:mid1-interacting protein 1-like isoform X1 [Penaeus japonicus]